MKNLIIFPFLLITIFIFNQYPLDLNYADQTKGLYAEVDSDVSEALQGAWTSSEVNEAGEKKAE